VQSGIVGGICPKLAQLGSMAAEKAGRVTAEKKLGVVDCGKDKVKGYGSSSVGGSSKEPKGRDGSFRWKKGRKASH